MYNGQLSILNDHNTSNRLLQTEPSQNIRLLLRYNDQREGLEKKITVQSSTAVTIRDIIKEFLKFVNLERIRPEDVSLVEVIQNRRYHIPIENAHMTLNELNIENGCTLCFEPSLTSIAQKPLYLSIWLQNNVGKAEYKWYKATTTLNMLLEHVIKVFSLEAIERERIHLFTDFEELNLDLNCDKLLSGLGIRNNAFIDVEIIPPISRPIPFMNTSTSNEFLSSLNGQSSTNSLHQPALSQRIQLKLQYTDRQQDLRKVITAQFSPTTTIRDVTKELLKATDLEHIRPEDINLLEILHDRHYNVPVDNANKTLNQLMIVDGCTLYFEPSSTSESIKPWFLTVTKLDANKKVEYKWKKSIPTLGMLLEHIIEDFSLKSIERKRIRLTTLLDKNLDHISYSNRLISELGITNYEGINVDIAPSGSFSIDSRRLNVCVECSYTSGLKQLDVPHTITIGELKNQIEKQFKDHVVIDLKLFDRMHYPIDMSNPTQTLSYFGIEPGVTVYASLKLAYSGTQLSTLNTGSDTAIRSSSLIAKPQPDEVTVICKVSACEPVKIKASVNDTVAELIKKVETLKKNGSLAQIDMWSGSINIDTEQPSRRLSDYGIIAGDIIDVKIIEKIPVKYVLEDNRVSTSLMLNNLSRTQQFDSKPVGLANLGNTCYMNSALQCLAHAKLLTQFFLDALTQSFPENDTCIDTEWNQFYTIGAVTGAYADVLRNLWVPNRTPYYSYLSFRPTHIKETIGLQAPRFATYDQQDAQEFMTYLLDEIHKELKEKNGNESNTIIEDLFFGRIQSTITCLTCQHQVKTTNPISFLPLPLTLQGRTFTIKFIAKDGNSDFSSVSVPENGNVKSIIQVFVDSRPRSFFWRTITPMTNDGQLDLEMPLSNLSIREVTLVEQDDYISSSQFYRSDKYSKKLTLADCLREFCSIENLEDSWLCEQDTCKKHTKATKQLQLYNLPPILIIQFKRFSHENGLRHKIETFVDYPIDGLDLSSFLSSSSSSEDAIYDLFAVSNHTGSINGGHYIAYARHETNGKNEWYKFDDSFVLSFCSDSSIVSKDAYLLFYMKRDKPKQSTAVTTS